MVDETAAVGPPRPGWLAAAGLSPVWALALGRADLAALCLALAAMIAWRSRVLSAPVR